MSEGSLAMGDVEAIRADLAVAHDSCPSMPCEHFPDVDDLPRFKARLRLAADVEPLLAALAAEKARADAEQAARTREFREMMRLIAAITQEHGGELRVKAFTLIALDDSTVLERYDDPATDEVVFRVRPPRGEEAQR